MIPEKWHVTAFALCVLALAALILWWIERKPPTLPPPDPRCERGKPGAVP